MSFVALALIVCMASAFPASVPNPVGTSGDEDLETAQQFYGGYGGGYGT